jgi:hypothetical protein
MVRHEVRAFFGLCVRALGWELGSVELCPGPAAAPRLQCVRAPGRSARLADPRPHLGNSFGLSSCSVSSYPAAHPIRSHQAAEALGAIGDVGSLAVLRKYLDDSHVEVRETCEIAIAKIEFDNSAEGLEEARLSKENGSVCVLIPPDLPLGCGGSFRQSCLRQRLTCCRPHAGIPAGRSRRLTLRRATTSLRPRRWLTPRGVRPSCRRRRSPS